MRKYFLKFFFSGNNSGLLLPIPHEMKLVSTLTWTFCCFLREFEDASKRFEKS